MYHGGLRNIGADNRTVALDEPAPIIDNNGELGLPQGHKPYIGACEKRDQQLFLFRYPTTSYLAQVIRLIDDCHELSGLGISI